jgi:DNA-binding transcriptional ArsR family regulator
MKRCRTSSNSIKDQKFISPDTAGELMNLFKVLTSETRLRLIHALILKEELCVSDLSNIVEMKPQAVSNQLQRLVDKDIVASRREGNQIYYKINDPCVINLLELGLCLLEESKKKRPRMEKFEISKIMAT